MLIISISITKFVFNYFHQNRPTYREERKERRKNFNYFMSTAQIIEFYKVNTPEIDLKLTDSYIFPIALA